MSIIIIINIIITIVIIIICIIMTHRMITNMIAAPHPGLAAGQRRAGLAGRVGDAEEAGLYKYTSVRVCVYASTHCLLYA